MVTPITQGQNSAFATADLFDTETSPLDRPDSAGYVKILNEATVGLQLVNCAQLVDFLRPDGLMVMQAETESLAGEAVYHEADLTPHFGEEPEGPPADHPLNRFSPRRHVMVRADRVARDGVIWSVFQNPDLCRFAADALEYETPHTYRDPYGSANVNVRPEVCVFARRFENDECAVSFDLKQAEEGGGFEYVPNLPGREDENDASVQRVLDGDRSDPRSLILRPGDLQQFRDGNTLHRVKAPKDGGRQSLLLSYVTFPDDITSAEKAIRIWGDAPPDHHARDRQLADTL